jgi:hypothetical protein
MGASEAKVSDSTTSSTQEAETVINAKYADVTLRILEDHGDEFGPLTPEKEKQLRRKLYWHVMGLLSAINLLLFVCHAQEGCLTCADSFRLTSQPWVILPCWACLKRPGLTRLSTTTSGLSSMLVCRAELPSSYVLSNTLRIHRRAVARTLCHAKASIREIRRWARLHVGCHPPPPLRRNEICRPGSPATGPGCS